MRQLFAVTRTRGIAWKQGSALGDQEDWASHAVFMNGLHAEGLFCLEVRSKAHATFY